MFDMVCGFINPSIPSRLRAGALLRVCSSREGQQVLASCETMLNSYMVILLCGNAPIAGYCAGKGSSEVGEPYATDHL